MDAGEAVRRGVLQADPHAQVLNIPVADGGEGTIDAIIGDNRDAIRQCEVIGPLGERIRSGYGVLPNRTAVIEMSMASGLLLVPEDKRNPLATTTYGTGQLIKAALDAGYRKMLIGLGGSATNDGGAGMAQALGASLRDEHELELGYGGAALARLHTIDCSGLDPRLKECEFTCAIDVNNLLCGTNGASAIYGPQKGANDEMIAVLDSALGRYAEKLKSQCGIDVSTLLGGGAAGGLGAGLYAFCGAKFKPGIEAVLDIVGFDAKLEGVDLVFTGEGRIDGQTLSGKVPIGVAQRVKAQLDAPVLALVGSIGQGAQTVYDCGIDGVYAIANGPCTLAESCEHVEDLLEQIAFALTRTLLVARRHANSSLK